MDDQVPPENPPKDFNKIDLAQLQGFSFGTQWTQDKSAPGGSRPPREPRRDDRPPRDRDGGGADAPRRDRRDFRRPAGPGPGAAPAGAAPAPGREGGERFAGPRRDDRGGGYRGPSRDGDPRFGGPRESAVDRGPYISPYFTVTFYPEDASFAALAKTIRSSCRTFELFEIARVFISKHDRYVAVIERRGPEEAAPAAAPVKPAPLAVAVPDGVPFENEEAAIAHVLAKHLGQFFETSEVEVEPPKGNFQVVNKCGLTGELLGPPNYHRYNQIIQQHHAARVSQPFEVFRNRIEGVRDPEVINQWLEKMKKVTRYTWKLAAEGETAPGFDTIEEARQHLLTQARDKVVRTFENARFLGKNIDTLPPGEIRRALEGSLERQRRFSLETANALRGRLRREGFTIFKKGAKGISYVCAVKRKFRVPGQVFADSINALIGFIETHPMIKAGELPEKFLGLKAAAIPAAAPAAEGETAAPAAAPEVSAEDKVRHASMQGNLRWLVTEGYVIEFIDGRLFAPPAMVEARKQEVESAEHDPENFPEAPAAAPESASAAVPVETPPEAAPVETAPEASAPAGETPTAAAPETATGAAPEVTPD